MIPDQHRPVSLAQRVALLVGITIAVCFIILGALVQRSIMRHFAEQDADELRVVAQSVEKAILGEDKFVEDTLLSRLANAVSGHHNIYFGVFDKDDLPIYSGDGPNFTPLLNSAAVAKSIYPDELYTWHADGHEYQGAVLALESLADFQGGIRIAVALTTDFHRSYMASFRKTLWGLMLVAGILTIVAAWIAIRVGHRPLQRLSREIQGIDAQQLDYRLNPAKVPKELNELVLSFNKMISRVEDGFEHLSRFSADIAHELRTPITNLSTQTQVALNKERTTGEYRDVLYSNLEEYERLSTMIRDMLWLAQSDNKQLTLARIPVNLREEIQALIDYFEPLAEEQQASIHVSGDSVVAEVDRTLFRRALNNLISNAIAHSSPGKEIWISVTRNTDHADISIENAGEPIDARHLGRLFDRFYRIDPARGRTQSEGVGLGLSIVKSIAELHGGTITVMSEAGNTRFMLCLPLATVNRRPTVDGLSGSDVHRE